jgi:hypothetical protein
MDADLPNIADPQEPPKMGLLRRLAVPIGVGIVALAVIGAGAAVALTRFDLVRPLTCKIGLFCVAPTPAKPIAGPVHVCPKPKLTATFHPRASEEQDAHIAAEVSGPMRWSVGAETRTGAARGACFDKEFLVTFETKPDGPLVQCLGTIDGQTYVGICSSDAAGTGTISGTFTN